MMARRLLPSKALNCFEKRLPLLAPLPREKERVLQRPCPVFCFQMHAGQFKRNTLYALLNKVGSFAVGCIVRENSSVPGEMILLKRGTHS